MSYKFPYRFAGHVNPRKKSLSNFLVFGSSAVVPFVSALHPESGSALLSILTPQLPYFMMDNINLNCYDRIPRDRLPQITGLRVKEVDGEKKNEWYSEPISRADVYFENSLIHALGLAVSGASYGLGYLARNCF
jgi:hypothetical protein